MRLHIATGWRQLILSVDFFCFGGCCKMFFPFSSSIHFFFWFCLFRSNLRWGSCPSAPTCGTTDQWTAKTIKSHDFIRIQQNPQKVISNNKGLINRLLTTNSQQPLRVLLTIHSSGVTQNGWFFSPLRNRWGDLAWLKTTFAESFDFDFNCFNPANNPLSLGLGCSRWPLRNGMKRKGLNYEPLGSVVSGCILFLGSWLLSFFRCIRGFFWPVTLA